MYSSAGLISLSVLYTAVQAIAIPQDVAAVPSSPAVAGESAWAAPSSVVASGDWQTQVTWPAGCHTWANPCPTNAIVAGGDTAAVAASSTDDSYDTTTTYPASYTNPFTSYLTQTNSYGVVTGMPSKVTSQPSVITAYPTGPVIVSTPTGPSVVTVTTQSTSSERPYETSSTSSSFNQPTMSSNNAIGRNSKGGLVALAGAAMAAILL